MKKHSYRNPVGVSRFTGLLLITPFIIGFAAFILYPFICSFILGMTEYNGISAPKFIGSENYTQLLHDEKFGNALAVTLKYAALLVPLKLLVSLCAALLLNAEIRGIGFYRTALYVPSILGANLSVVIMWQYLFTSDGLVNQLLKMLGAAPVSWYGEPAPAMFMIVLLRLWEFGSTMIIFLTALRDIPRELYDAARVDGCGGFRAFIHITLPQLKSVIFINLVLQTIAAMQEFNAPYMLTDGGPLGSTYTLGMLIYNEMFGHFNMGYANAVSWTMFAVIGLVVLIMFRVTGRRRDSA